MGAFKCSGVVAGLGLGGALPMADSTVTQSSHRATFTHTYTDLISRIR
jgi:hypothetical protein